jgi:hypothetical protein
MRLDEREVQGTRASNSITFTLVAEVAEIDGSPTIDEDMLEMDLQGVLAVTAEGVEHTALFRALSLRTSSTSSSERVNQRIESAAMLTSAFFCHPEPAEGSTRSACDDAW